MSTFSGLNTAYSGLQAARAGLEVTGQNITNAGTAGYTRQRLTTQSATPPAQIGPITGSNTAAGQGVILAGVARLSDSFLDAGVRNASATSGYAQLRSTSLTEVEQSFNEPGPNGLSAQLQSFWASWQDLANSPNDASAGAAVLQNAAAVTGQIAGGYTAIDSAWTKARSQVDSLASQLNDAADHIASLNTTIRQTMAAGGSVNELLDQRAQLTSTVASIAGGSVVNRLDGTVDLTIGGNLLVSGSSANHVQVSGATDMTGTAVSAVRVEWAQRPGQSIGLDGGSLAGALSLVAPANGSGTGGVLAETANAYNQLATQLAAQVNAIHSTSVTTDGRTGLDFFGVAAGGPAALGLSVVPTTPADIAAGRPGAGSLDGSAADAVSQLASGAGSPDRLWSNMVSTIGSLSRVAMQQATLAGTALTNAKTAQTSSESVDLDEENMNMLQQQTSYQAAARMMTAVDSLLDTLINHTGLVGLSG
ncbi:MAG: flagellar hook-associated protein FlgK [Microbacteriaceae bacterium]|nr:MAG: flagellar hook-associated protein FlgK [Microbacteriaceae bacterium]